MPDGRLERTRRAYRLDFEPEGAYVPIQLAVYEWSDDALKLFRVDVERGVRCECGSFLVHPHAPECRVHLDKGKGECPAYG